MVGAKISGDRTAIPLRLQYYELCSACALIRRKAHNIGAVEVGAVVGMIRRLVGRFA
jgi:hypothetical protein